MQELGALKPSSTPRGKKKKKKSEYNFKLP